MPVRWNTYKVSQAVDLIEEHLQNCDAPLDLAKEETRKALGIPGLPQYMEAKLRSLAFEAAETKSRLHGKIESLRNDIPKEQIANDKAVAEAGDMNSLV